MGDEPEAAQTAAGESAARHTRTLCVQVRGLGPEDDGGLQTTTAFPHGIHSISVSFRSILRRTAWSPWGSGREAILTAGPPLSLIVMKSQRLDSFSRTFSPPLLSFAPMFVGVLIKVLGFATFCNKLAAPERCTGHSVSILSAQNWGGASCSLRSL